MRVVQLCCGLDEAPDGWTRWTQATPTPSPSPCVADELSGLLMARHWNRNPAMRWWLDHNHRRIGRSQFLIQCLQFSFHSFSFWERGDTWVNIISISSIPSTWKFRKLCIHLKVSFQAMWILFFYLHINLLMQANKSTTSSLDAWSLELHGGKNQNSKKIKKKKKSKRKQDSEINNLTNTYTAEINSD